MIFLIALLSYFLGSIPSGYIIGKIFFKTDIRKLGSGNVGSTNALRNFGKAAGIGTLLCDALKGFLAVFIADKLAGANAIAVAFIFVVLGHMYSIFLHFKSGKGVATSFGALIYIDLRFVLILAAIFIIIVLTSRIVSLASILASFAAMIVGYFYFGLVPIYYSILLVAALIIYKHRTNIQRLIKREESKIF